MRPTNYPQRMAFRCSPETRKALEKLVKKGKASDLSEAVRYCIENTCEAALS